VRSLSIVASIALAACGPAGPTRGTPPPARPGAGSAAPPAAKYSGEKVCRGMADAAARCKFPLDEISPDECARTYEVESRSKDGKQLEAAGRCFVEMTSCDGLTECLTAMLGKELRKCDETDSVGRRVGIPAAEWVRRNGAGATTFSGARSTRDTPIEMCGITEANVWLTTLRCDDGSRPVRSRPEAENTRAGNVGEAGRCGSIVDRYVVPCPEMKYEIFIDAYVCPLPEP
jgi:hypothetical protein